MKKIFLLIICFTFTMSHLALAQSPKLDETKGKRKIETVPDKVATFEADKLSASEWIKNRLPAMQLIPDTAGVAPTVFLFFNLVINEEGKVIRAPIVGAMDIDVAWKKKVSAIVRDMPYWKPAEKDGQKVVSMLAVTVNLF